MRVPAESGTTLETETADHEREPVRPSIANETPKARTTSEAKVVRSEVEQRAGQSKKAAEVAAVGKEKDKELEEFLDTVPLAKRADPKYVKEHYGRTSDRRTASGAYSNDRDNRFTYKGKLVNDGGYRRGRLKDIDREVKEFGPGDPWPGEVWHGKESSDKEEEKENEEKRYEELLKEDGVHKSKVMKDPGEPTEKEWRSTE